MAISATRIFERHPDQYDKDALGLHANHENPFKFGALQYTRDTRDSIAINSVQSGAVILAGSGMVSGGRVLHHLRQNLPRTECSVVFCGFQARGTTGRAIVDGAQFVRLYGESIPCQAQVHTINGFSAHAGQEELTAWAKQTKAKHVFLVHGEDESKAAFAAHLGQQIQTHSIAPMRFGQPVDLLALDLS